MAPIEGPQEGTKINLSMLIDFLLQKTYHELTVLSELLPRKSDIERKIEIVQFASRTRQQFVRLLALVKWASSAERVDKCQAISTVLDQQSMLFVDTADMLARMSRETLVKARLPTFCLPAAVDVLTSGTYPRLPTCIRDKIIPPDPITAVEKTKTLQRLNQVIQHRLVTSKLPPEMGNMSVGDGRVKFRIEHEFEVMLTVMGDDPSIPWRVLSIDFLVEDMETGDGKTLVHALQVQYIHQLVQSRLLSDENPLVDLYNCLHSFCLSLQLQVLHFQAKHLIGERWGENVRVEDYAVGKKLVVSYWRPTSGVQQSAKPACRITLSEDVNSSPTCLCVQHFPPLPPEYTREHPTIFHVSPGDLYIEKLLTLTIRAQSTVKLKELWQVLCQESSLKSKVTLDESTPSLVIQVSPNPTPAEIIVITVKTRSGHFQVSVGDGQDSTVCTDMENTLNSSSGQFISVLRDVRCQLFIKQFFKSTAHLPVVASLSLPIVNLSEHKLSKLSKHRLYIQFRRHPSFCLVVEVFCNEDSDEVTTRYHLLKVKRTFATDDKTQDNQTTESTSAQNSKQIQLKKEAGKDPAGQEMTSQSCGTDEEPGKAHEARRLKLVLLADHMVTLDPTRMTDYAGTPFEGLQSTKGKDEHKKRKLETPSVEKNDIKRQKTLKSILADCQKNSTYHPTLGHIVSTCHARIPFTFLREELCRNKIIHQGLCSEGGVGLAVRLSSLPLPKDCDHSLVSSLLRNVLDCVLRFPDETQRTCLMEMTFDNCPLEGFAAKEKGSTRHVFFEYRTEEAKHGSTDKAALNCDSQWYGSVVKKLLNDWCSVCKLYRHAVELDAYLKDSQSHLRHMCRVYSYNYKKLTLQYDPDKQSLVTFDWSVEQSQFVMTFGHCGSTVSGNPHCLTSRQLQQEFNKHQNLPYIVQILHDTFRPLSSIAKLSTKPVLGQMSRPLLASRNFAVLPQSSTHVLLVYRNNNHLEVRLKSKNLVAIRDASYSSFDPTKYKTGLTSVQNIKVFLQLFVDEVAKVGGITSRHASTADEEAPPSPISMETEAAVIEPQFTPPQTIPTAANMTASPIIARTSPQAPSASVNVPSPFSASPSVNSPGNIYGVPSPVSQLSAFLQPSPSAPQGSVQSPVGFLGFPMPSPASGHQFLSSSPAVGGACPALSHNVPITSPGSWPMSPQFAGGGQATKYRSTPTAQPTSGTAIKQTTPPQRPLTARTWAATVPTILSHAAFNKLCSPAASLASARWGSAIMLCPLERFLGCMHLKRHLVRLVHNDETLALIRNEPNCVGFKTSQSNSGLQYLVSVDSSYTSLRLNAKLLHGQEASWKEDLSTLEKFFETRVACAPYKTSAITAFVRLLGAPPNILRDCIKIMKLEMNPDPTCNWRVEWCLSIPPSGPEIAPPGTSAVVLTLSKGKMLFFIQLSKPIPSSPSGEEQIVVIPVVHDLQNNTIQQADIQRSNVANTAAAAAATASMSSSPAAVVNAFLKRWSDMTPRTGECTIYPAVLELARNLVLPP